MQVMMAAGVSCRGALGAWCFLTVIIQGIFQWAGSTAKQKPLLIILWFLTYPFECVFGGLYLSNKQLAKRFYQT